MSANEYEPQGLGFHLVQLLQAVLKSFFTVNLAHRRAQVLPAAILSQTSDWQGPGSPSKPAFTLSLWPIGLILPLFLAISGEKKVQPYLSAAWFPQQKEGGGEKRKSADSRVEWNGAAGNDRHFLKSYSGSYV